eukprot:gene4849-9580_t
MASAAMSKKLVIVGDGACGKTCLLQVFATGSFPEEYIPTVFENTIVDTVVDGRDVELALWDTAGQEDYDGMRPLSYPDTDVLLITFDISNPDSLENIEEKWAPEVQKFIPTTPIILVGTKSDIREDTSAYDAVVDEASGKDMASRIGAVGYVECSAMQNKHVTEVFHTAVRACLDAGEKPPTWDCRQLTKEHAMARLDAGETGTFVIRESGGQAVATLSMVKDVAGSKFHVRIFWDKSGGIRLNKAREIHKDIPALIKYHQHVQGVLPCKLLSEETPEWNCIELSKAEAEVKLLGKGPGAFIIRKASRGFAVLVYLEIEELDEEEVEGMPAGSIRIKGSRQAFVTVDDLADYYMRDATDDIPLQLTSPEELDEEEDDYGSLADPDSEL